jgi:type I restriction-modification system DNA methylase subunit
MIHQLSDNGIMACVLPHGVLFRGAAEGVIRKYLIKELNYLDAVIGLPANIFYGTSIPTCILVFKKSGNKMKTSFSLTRLEMTTSSKKPTRMFLEIAT